MGDAAEGAPHAGEALEGAVLGKESAWAPASFRYHLALLARLTLELLTLICPWQWQGKMEELGVGAENADQTGIRRNGKLKKQGEGSVIWSSPFLGTYYAPGDGLCPSFN